jgi:hypothetical protein
LLQASVSTLARITVSSDVSPGQYILALGFDAGTVRVWTNVHIQVGAQTPIALYIMNNLGLLAAAVIVVAAFAGLLLAGRSRGPSPEKEINHTSPD